MGILILQIRLAHEKIMKISPENKALFPFWALFVQKYVMYNFFKIV
jgi:hypothetical protein